MDIFFCINDAYVEKLCVVMVSILENHRNSNITFHVVSSDLSDNSKYIIEQLKKIYKNYNIVYYSPDREIFKEFNINIEYITIETYYRYIISELAPQIDKCLYLDADIVVNGSLNKFYNMDISQYYCAGVRDVFIEEINYKKKIGLKQNDLYINAGVLLLNLSKIRNDNKVEQLLDNTRKYADIIEYQDQDIINITFKNKIKEVSSIYNFTSGNVKHEKNRRNEAIIIHYTGKEKPWDTKCKNKLKGIWHKYYALYIKNKNRKIKVALLIDEFFGGAGTAFGGYGMLARRYVAKYIPNEDITIDVLLGKGRRHFWAEHYKEDKVDLYRLPRNSFFAKMWLKRKSYDVFLSIELTTDYVLKHETNPNTKLILWIQDPRPRYEWDEINTVKLFPETCYYNQDVYDTVHCWYENSRVKFISQGYFLNKKAIDLYNLSKDVPIEYCPNPVEIDYNFEINNFTKKDNIIFLGRIESVKRGWLFCEIAKRMPEYNFYMLGQSHREQEENAAIMSKYLNIPNLHFEGHVDGIQKNTFIKEAKILVNTSIHEALPVSFLEALSYGTLIVSNRNPENLTNRFGIYVGDVLGDGFDKVDLYVYAIKKLMNDKLYYEKSQSAINYVKENHNIDKFVKHIRNLIIQETRKNDCYSD